MKVICVVLGDYGGYLVNQRVISSGYGLLSFLLDAYQKHPRYKASPLLSQLTWT